MPSPRYASTPRRLPLAKHSITVFIGYRICLAMLVSILLITGVISAT